MKGKKIEEWVHFPEKRGRKGRGSGYALTLGHLFGNKTWQT